MIIRNILQKEWVSIFRDRRLLIILLLTFIVLLLALFSGYNRHMQLSYQKEELNKAMRQDWESQHEKHAHEAAHYGTYLYAPESPLSFFDNGIQNFVGNTLPLKAHIQQEPNYSAAAENGGSIRFGELSVALVLQTLMPLLIILLVFDTLSRERETHLLKILLLQGSSPEKILWQKIFSYTALSWAILWGTMALSTLLTIATGLNISIIDILLLGLLYSIYYFVIVCMGTVVSSLSKSSQGALIMLLGLWLFTLIVLPKLLANLADQLYPLPSKKQFQMAIAREVEVGIDGHDPANERTKQFTDSILKANRVDSIENLSINIDGLLMQEDENYRAKVTKKYFGKLQERILQQNRFTHWFSFIDPFIGVRDLSMALCQTDYLHHVAFQEQAQEYRLYMMYYLNSYMTKHLKPNDWETKSPKAFFASLKKFSFESPSLKEHIINHYSLLIISFMWWAIASVLLVYWASSKMKIL